MSDVYYKQSILLKSMLLSIFLEVLWMIELERKTAKTRMKKDKNIFVISRYFRDGKVNKIFREKTLQVQS